MRGTPPTFWFVWALGVVAVLVGYSVDWLNTGAFAGAYAILIALVGTTYTGRRTSQ
jgi:hypothetical protein